MEVLKCEAEIKMAVGRWEKQHLHGRQTASLKLSLGWWDYEPKSNALGIRYPQIQILCL